MVALGRKEHLRLVFQAQERLAVDDAVAVALEIGAHIARRFGALPPPRVFRKARVFGQECPLLCKGAPFDLAFVHSILPRGIKPRQAAVPLFFWRNIPQTPARKKTRILRYLINSTEKQKILFFRKKFRGKTVKNVKKKRKTRPPARGRAGYGKILPRLCVWNRIFCFRAAAADSFAACRAHRRPCFAPIYVWR